MRSEWDRQELAKYHNEPEPDCCDECGGELVSGRGMVGEEVLYCPNGHGLKWEDIEGAVRRVL